MPDKEQFFFCISTGETSEEAHALAIKLNPVNARDTDTTDDPGTGLGTLHQPLIGEHGKFWRVGSILRVSFTNGTAAQQDRVLVAARAWSQYANIQFEKVSAGPSEIRIELGHKKNSSFIGTDADLPTFFGLASMKYRGANPNADVVQHEFGHALGLHHAHQHPGLKINWNREVVYDYCDKNFGMSRQAVERNIFDRTGWRGKFVGRFDRHSIMTYEIPSSWTKDGFTIKDAGFLSWRDRSDIGDFYPYQGAIQPTYWNNGRYTLLSRGLHRKMLSKTWDGSGWDVADDFGTVLDGPISGAPAVAYRSASSGTIPVVARRRSDHAPVAALYKDGKWSDWQNLGGKITATPTLIWRQGRIWAFVRGITGRPFYKIQNSDLSWNTDPSGWDNLGGTSIGRITADSAGDYVAIAATSPKNEPVLKYHDSTAWRPGNTDWMTVGLHATSSPPAVRIMEGKAHLVIRTNYLNKDYLAFLYHAIVDLKTGQLEQDWQELGRGVLGDPCLIDGFDGKLHLFVRGTSHRIFRKIWNGGWTPEWENLGGEAIDSPTALAIPERQSAPAEIHLFCTGTTRRAFRKRWTASKWIEGQLGWENLGAELDCSY